MSIRTLYGAQKFIEQNKCSGFLRAGCGLRAGPRVGSIKIAGRGPGREQYLLKLRAAGRATVTKFRPACNSDVASCILHEICLLIELVIEVSLCITLFIHGFCFRFY